MLPLNIDWQQILLHLFNFAILGGGLYFLLYKPVKSFMDQREAYYRTLDSQAKEQAAQAEQLKAECQARLDAVEDEIRQRRAEAQRELQQSMRQQMDQSRKQAQQIITEAHQAAQQEREKILRSADRELIGLATVAAEKILLRGQGDPYDQFLRLAEEGGGNNEQA